MIISTLSVAIPPGKRREIFDVFWSVLPLVRVEAGCLACKLYFDEADSDMLLYVEIWASVEQLERHMRSTRYDRLLAIMEASAQAPVLRYYSVAEGKGMEYLESVRLGRTATPAVE